MSRMADNTPMTTQSPNRIDLPQQLSTFGSTLQAAYRRAQLSKRQLAAAASLDRSAISRIERGERAPKFDKLLLLARAAKTTPAALLAEIGPHDRTIPRLQYEGGPASDHDDPVKRFGANLKWVREHVDPRLTQEELALEAEIDRSSPNGYETGRMSPPTLRTILRLAVGLGVSPSVLMEGVQLGE
jgi:transcriptional regulator with XRE-family HTH domain